MHFWLLGSQKLCFALQYYGTYIRIRHFRFMNIKKKTLFQKRIMAYWRTYGRHHLAWWQTSDP